jgi:hypothetical protein
MGYTILHINMEIQQGNSMCSYLKQPKISFFSSSLLIQNQRTGGLNRSCLGVLVPVGEWGGDG